MSTTNYSPSERPFSNPDLARLYSLVTQASHKKRIEPDCPQCGRRPFTTLCVRCGYEVESD